MATKRQAAIRNGHKQKILRARSCGRVYTIWLLASGVYELEEEDYGLVSWISGDTDSVVFWLASERQAIQLMQDHMDFYGG